MDARNHTGMARPTTSRPLTSTRTSTGGGALFGPISSRGKTALRRQIQDKSYFVGLIKAKVTEITNERNVLVRECDIMAKEEARIGVYREKAENLAIELKELNLELSTYNEFLERSRTGSTVENINDDILAVKQENNNLSTNLENEFGKLKNYEKMVKKNEEELNRIINDMNQVKEHFTDEQRATYSSLSKVHNDLLRESSRLESEIAVWKGRKERLESTIINDEENMTKIQLLKSMQKLRELEKQKVELDNTENNDESEIADLLSQIKHDNGLITTLESNLQEINKNLDDIRKEIEFLSDPDKITKINDLKNNDKNYDEYLVEFEQKRDIVLGKIQASNHDISDLTSKLSRSTKYMNGLKKLNKEPRSILNELIIEKRRLELEHNKVQQQTSKNQQDFSQNTLKIQKLNEQIQLFSDVTRLKQQMEDKLRSIEQQTDEKARDIEQLKLDKTQIETKTRDAELQLEQHALYPKFRELEKSLAEVSKVLTNLKANDQTQLLNELRSLAMEKVKKYNQNLLGF